MSTAGAIHSEIPRRLLIVDDEPAILAPLVYYFTGLGYEVLSAKDALEGLELFKRHRPPLIITDLKMPGMGGDALLAEIKKVDEYAQIIIITGFATIQSAIATLKAGAFDYISKPFRLEVVGHAVAKAFEHMALLWSNRQLQEDSIHVLEAMVNTLEQRDYYTAGHSRRVTAWAEAVAERIGLSGQERRIIHLGGMIHDVGKIGIDDAILRKPGRLTREEYEVIKSHPERGVKIVEPLEFLRETIPLIRHHHERFDGSGYPDGLRGERIPLSARILSLADTYDAMTSSRAYREALSDETAIGELSRCAGTQFDPDLVSVFLAVSRPGEGGSPAAT